MFRLTFICLFVVFVFFIDCHAPSLECRAFDGCIVRSRIALPFIARFRRRFQPFFKMDCSFRWTTKFSFYSLVGAIIFAKLRSKLRKTCASIYKKNSSTSLHSNDR